MSKPKLFRTSVLGVGPYCVEFDDGEIITTRLESRQRLIAAAMDLLEALNCIPVEAIFAGGLATNGVRVTLSPGTLQLMRAAVGKAEGR